MLEAEIGPAKVMLSVNGDEARFTMTHVFEINMISCDDNK